MDQQLERDLLQLYELLKKIRAAIHKNSPIRELIDNAIRCLEVAISKTSKRQKKQKLKEAMKWLYILYKTSKDLFDQFGP